MQRLPPWLHSVPDGVRLALRVQPGARRCALLGVHGQRLKVAVNAPPAQGRANEALLRYLAQCLGLRTASLRLLTGASSRDKSVLIECEPSQAEQIAARLTTALGDRAIQQAP